jgi:hypothetical protein
MKILSNFLIVSFTLISLFLGSLFNGEAQAEQLGSATMEFQTCGERRKVTNALKQEYSEVQESIGISNNGALVEVFTSSTGTFTITLTVPNGTTCVISAGENWNKSIRKTKMKPGA